VLILAFPTIQLCKCWTQRFPFSVESGRKPRGWELRATDGAPATEMRRAYAPSHPTSKGACSLPWAASIPLARCGTVPLTHLDCATHASKLLARSVAGALRGDVVECTRGAGTCFSGIGGARRGARWWKGASAQYGAVSGRDGRKVRRWAWC
jgi:hypothetical protein